MTKVAQMFGDFSGTCENHCFFKSNCLDHFLGNFWKTWATFLFQHQVTLAEKKVKLKKVFEKVSDFKLSETKKL